jgi:predicted nucleic acid-binding protein
MAWLLDVNALLALIDPVHVHHDSMHRWFETRNPQNWATCPLVENGPVRVLSQPSYRADAALPLR